MIAALAIPLLAGGAEPVVQWATVAGSEQDDYPYSLALGPSGEIYLAGWLDGVTDFRPNTVLYQFDSRGNQVRSQAGRGEVIQGVAVDSRGNYLLTGFVVQPDTLGIGLRNHFYLAKYSPAGTLLWERTAGLPTYVQGLYQEGKAIAIDANDDILVAGTSTGEAVFGNFTLPLGAGGPLLCKYAGDGKLRWVKRVENATGGSGNGIGNGGWAYGIALDAAGNIITTGYLYKGTADFGGTIVSIQQNADSYTAKYNGNGAVQWVRLGHGCLGVAVDKQGDIYFTGSVFGPGGGPMECGKFTATGELAWVRTLPGAYGNGVALDAKGEPVFVGEFYGTLQLDDQVVPEPTARGISVRAASTVEPRIASGGGSLLAAL